MFFGSIGSLRIGSAIDLGTGYEEVQTVPRPKPKRHSSVQKTGNVFVVLRFVRASASALSARKSITRDSRAISAVTTCGGSALSKIGLKAYARIRQMIVGIIREP